jgi:cytoskeleton protein RodZ
VSQSEFVPGFGDIGARLRVARERLGMSVAQAAERLHCDRDLVESMDSGRFAELGAPVFVRGHLRRYAELVGVPVGEVLELWEREAAGHLAAPDITQIPTAKRPRDARRLLLPVGIAALIVLFALLISWVLRNPTLPQTGGRAAAPAADSSAESAAPEADSPRVDAATDSAAGAPAGAPGASALLTRPAASDNAEPAPPEASGSLRIRASADCWLEVYDADRRRLYFNLLRAGDSTSVTGRMPLRVLLGNVPGVELEFAGRPLSVPAGLQRANTASFLLAADGALRAAARD